MYTALELKDFAFKIMAPFKKHCMKHSNWFNHWKHKANDIVDQWSSKGAASPPWGQSWRARGRTKLRRWSGDKQHKLRKNALPLINHWV